MPLSEAPPSLAMPALLTRKWTPPSRVFASRTNVSTAWRSRTSQRDAYTPTPIDMSAVSVSSVCPPTIGHNLVDEGIFPAFRLGSRLYFDVRTKEMLKQVIQSVGSVGSRANR